MCLAQLIFDVALLSITKLNSRARKYYRQSQQNSLEGKNLKTNRQTMANSLPEETGTLISHPAKAC